jgi:predicted Zn-dependent peptidase
MALVRENLLREFERNSQDNDYFLNEIVRRYANGDTANLAAIANLPDRIKMLTGDEVYEAAQAYLDTDRYVKVILTPAR